MMDDHDDFAFEPVPGLPDRLPDGEAMLWQGSPDWRALAASAFHVRKVAAYFAIVIVWRALAATGEAASATALLTSALTLLAIAGVATAILCGLAFFYARGTIYTLTTKRIVIRSGLALPVTLNLPLALVETVALARGKGKTGSIALSFTKPNRIAYVALWPNARPFHVNHPQPMLRGLTDVDLPAGLLARVLEGGTVAVRLPLPQRSSVAAGRPVSGMPAGRRMAV